MSDEERTGTRNLDYSAWHRSESIVRFLNDQATAKSLVMIDLDAVECDLHMNPVALIETTQQKSHKPVSMIRNLARMANLPAFLVHYETGKEKNPVNDKRLDIVGFRVRRVYPEPEPEPRPMTPKEFTELLVSLRRKP